MIILSTLVPLIVGGCSNPAATVAVRPATITSTATATATVTIAGSTVRTTATTTVRDTSGTRTPLISSIPASTAASVSSAPASGAIAPLDGDGAPVWPSGNRVGVAPSPALNGRLDRWSFVSTWTATVRAVDGAWAAAPGSELDDLRFPALTSGCERGRFLVVWTAATEGPQITAGFATAPSGTGAVPVTGTDSPVTAGAGWMALDGCRIPAFMLRPNDAAANFSDVFVSVERYGPAGT